MHKDGESRMVDVTQTTDGAARSEVPVEGLAVGLLNALGDGVGLVAGGGKALSSRLRPASDRSSTTDGKLPVTAPEHAAYMGGRVVRGVREIGRGGLTVLGGTREMALGGVDVVAGALGCVIAGVMCLGGGLLTAVRVDSPKGGQTKRERT